MRIPVRMIVFIFLVFGSISPLNAKDVYHLDGYMGVRGGESFHYSIDLKDSIGNILSGYGYTYKTKDKVVKAYLTAEIDRGKKSLHIQEQQIISNQGFESKATICLVNAFLTWNKDENNLSGSLITQTSGNGATCSSGTIVFIQKLQIDQLFAPPIPTVAQKSNTGQLPQFQTRVDPNKKLNAYFAQKTQTEKATQQQPTPPAPPIVAPKPEIKKITEGTEGVYQWHSNKVIFEIWDGGEIDNDQVTVSFNGTIVLKNYQLTAQKKKLTFELGGNELNIITITANNEGSNPPNTANIILYDGDKAYSVLAYNKTRRKAVIKIKKGE